MPIDIAPDQTHDPDDVEALRDDATRENAALARELSQNRTRRELRRDAGGDTQEFRDQIEASLPTTTMDELADASRENQELERLDVLEALRNLQSGDPIRWRIYRQGHENPDLNGYLAEWTTSQLTQERLKNEFGGGTYKIRGQHSDGKYAGGRTIHIAGDAIRKEKDYMSSQTAGVNVAELITAQATRDEARRRDEDRQRALDRKDLEEKEERRRKERNELLMIVVPALTGLTTAIVGAFAANRGPDLGTLLAAVKGPDPLALMIQLKQLEDKPNNDGLLAKILPTLLERASDGAREGDTGWLDVVKELAKSAGPAVGGMIEAAMVQARSAPGSSPPSGTFPAASTNIPPSIANAPMTVAVRPPQPPAPPGLIVVPESQPRRERRPPRTVSEPSPVDSRGVNPLRGASPAHTAGGSSAMTPNGEDMNLLQLMPLLKHRPWLVEQLARLGPAAARQKDPELYAALFLEELPEDVPADVLGGLLSREDWFVLLAEVDPRINSAELYPWFEVLRGYLLQSLRAESGAPGGGIAPQPTPAVAAPVSNPVPSTRTPSHGEIDRPTRLPSLTGEIE